ncbi:hypothetical protein [Chryseobacterium salviniae]|uniref:Uncharacterized protein n=1 Tax=Chryseobacterium salviniae TaxID=3101750 RepID=A0ABU6HNY6_9FLAO|nr:hypothetical protein [Chryseobacterium sp. T9W2-O]MEC3874316.1 hypothetical protein [Chryseobacterium sp. T9W2-O]
MEKIKKFILSFIKDEFNCNKAKTDVAITDSNYENLKNKTQNYFHSVVPNSYGRGMSQEELLNDEEIYQDLYRRNVTDAVPRTLFQIKQYKNPKLGEGLPRWLVNDDLFACYTSYTENTGRELGYNKLFYVAETNEGLKIIYDLTFGVKEPGWRHSHDLKINHVKDPGKLIAVEKYQVPEEANSLADYNAE